MRIIKLISLLTAGAVLLGSAACSDDEPTDTACMDYSGVSGTASFANDVMPIFQQSCNFSVCHSSAIPSPEEDLALGPESGITVTQADLDAVHAAIVGQASRRSSLNLVEAGEPGASWLLAKMEYADLTACSTNACSTSASGCGSQMPLGSTAVDESERAKIRAWIAAGAPNN